MPTLNSTDETYVLHEWIAGPGSRVEPGQVLAVVETSKALTDLCSPGAGFLAHGAAAGTVCRPGKVVGRLWPDRPSAVAADGGTAGDASGHPRSAPATEGGPGGAGAPAQPVPTGDPAELVLTEAARELALRYGITDSWLRSIGRRVIRAADVETLHASDVEAPHPTRGIAGEPGSPAVSGFEELQLSLRQRAVARIVSRSAATIPAAFVLTKVAADAVLAREAKARRTLHRLIGMPEQLMIALGAVHQRHRPFFCRVSDDLRLTFPARLNVGIAMDVGTGLQVPVVSGVEELSPAEVSHHMMRLRAAALRGRFSAEQSGDPGVTLALETASDTVLSVPLVLPGTVCTLSIGALQSELILGSTGEVLNHQYFYLGLSYDHRVVNGRSAGELLAALRTVLESAEPWFGDDPPDASN